MQDRWEDPTESVLGENDDPSFELDVEFAALDAEEAWTDPKSGVQLSDLWPDAGDPRVVHPDLVIFDPMGFSLAETLGAIGFGVRVAHSGVEVMHQIAAAPTGAVVCGPAEDAERRRLLTAAIRLRFPHIPVVYVSTHGGDPRAVAGAKAEGASIVVPLPLPDARDIVRLLGPFAPQKRTSRGKEVDEDEDATLAGRPKKVAPPPVPDDAVSASVYSPLDAPTENMDLAARRPGNAPVPLDTDDFDIPATFPGDADPAENNPSAPGQLHQSERITKLRNQTNTPAHFDVVRTDPQEIRSGTSGEVGELLRAISPFLWGLEDAANWADALGETGDTTARTHARTLKLIARLLTQLQEKIEDRGL